MNFCLIEMQKYFRVHGKNCSDFGLTNPTNFDFDDCNEILNVVNEKKIGEDLFKTLNRNQLSVVNTIIERVKNFNCLNKNAFYIDGPGKFILYN